MEPCRHRVPLPIHDKFSCYSPYVRSQNDVVSRRACETCRWRNQGESRAPSKKVVSTPPKACIHLGRRVRDANGKTKQELCLFG